MQINKYRETNYSLQSSSASQGILCQKYKEVICQMLFSGCETAPKWPQKERLLINTHCVSG